MTFNHFANKAIRTLRFLKTSWTNPMKFVYFVNVFKRRR